MTTQRFDITDIKERIAVGRPLTPTERDFVIDCIGEATKPIAVYDPGSNLGIIDSLWAALAISDGGEGICSGTIGYLGSVPMVAAKWSNMQMLMPVAREVGKATNKVIRIVKFKRNEVVESFQP